MNEKQLNNLKQIGFLFVKLAIVFGAFYFIYNRLFFNEKLDIVTLQNTINQHNVIRVNTIILLFVFSLANWLFEIFKWKTLIGHIKPISFYNALEQTIGAHTAALFTPNKIGEFGAKALYYVSRWRKHVLLLTFVGNSYQLLATVFFGIIGLTFVIIYYHISINFNLLYQFLIALLFVGYLFLVLTKQQLLKIKGFSVKNIINYLKKLPFGLHFKTLGLAFLRYAIFSHQFYFLLFIFHVPVDYFTAMCLITSMYLLTSFIPMLFFLDVIVKGSVAVFLFDLIGAEEVVILCIITIMWLFNFVLPSFFGGYFILNFNQYKQVSLD